MKLTAIFGAALAAAAILVAGPAAAAVTLTFKVTLDASTLVQRGAGVGYTPSELEFFETWTFTPTLSKTPGGTYAPPGPLTYNWSGEDAVGEGTAGVDTAIAASGLDASTDYSRGTFKNRRVFDADGNRTFAASEFSLDQQNSEFQNTAGGGFAFQNWARYLFGAQGNYLASSLYDNAMIEFLTGRELSYRVAGSQQAYDAGFNLVQDDYFEILGKAVLVSYSGESADPAGPNGRETYGAPPAGVPEPATWALMLGGFGLAGAALRRRRAVNPA